MHFFYNSLSSKGSTLVFSLVVLAFLLVSATSLAAVAVSEKRAALSSAKSNLSFQAADSGAEVILVGIKKGDDDPGSKTSISDFFSACNGGEVSADTSNGAYTVMFYDSANPANQLGCSDARADVVKIISKGFYANTTRAIEVGIPPVPLLAP